MAFPKDLISENNDTFTGPAVGDEQLDAAEKSLEVNLPLVYRELVKIRNGFRLTRTFVPTDFETSWSPEGFEVKYILGVGFQDGIDGEDGSAYLINEWGYPEVGLVIGVTPSAGHDTVMLDYRNGRNDPKVVYVDEDRKPREVARSFEDFLELLTQGID